MSSGDCRGVSTMCNRSSPRGQTTFSPRKRGSPRVHPSSNKPQQRTIDIVCSHLAERAPTINTPQCGRMVAKRGELAGVQIAGESLRDLSPLVGESLRDSKPKHSSHGVTLAFESRSDSATFGGIPDARSVASPAGDRATPDASNKKALIPYPDLTDIMAVIRSAVRPQTSPALPDYLLSVRRNVPCQSFTKTKSVWKQASNSRG
jgi:hypothetical protein